MKRRNYLFTGLFVFYSILAGYAQCGVTTSNDTTVTCGSLVQLDIVPTALPDVISWSPATGLSATNISNPTANPIVTTTYYVTVTIGACTAMDSVTITINPLTADAGADKNFICGGSVQLDNVISNYSGAGTLSYSWSPTVGLNAANVASPIVSIIKQTTKYYVTVTSPNGCIAKDSVTVIVDPLKVNAGKDKNLTCGNTIQLNIAKSNYTGAGNLTYAWFPVTGLNSSSSPNPTSTIKQTTSYSLTLTTADGCTSVDTVVVTVGALTIDAGTDKMLSCGNTVGISTSTNYTGAAPLVYAWTPSTGLNLSYIANPNASPGQTTKYFVNITTFNGCTAVDSVIVNVYPLEIEAGSDRTIICGGEAQLQVVTNYTGAGSPDYNWTPSNDLNLSNVANPVASVNQNTTFYVTVTTLNGCKAIDTVNVIVKPLIANAGVDRTFICGATNQLLATSNYTGADPLNYKWTPGSGLNLSNVANPIVSVTSNSTFVVNITTMNGCSAKDTINIIVNPLTINAGNDKLHICGKRIQLDSILTNYTGTDPLTYTWSPKAGLNNSGIPNPTTNEGDITYTVTISTPFGACKATDQVKVGLTLMNGVDVCMVTLDSATSKNVVVWNKPEEHGIDSFLIYKETNILGNYIKVGKVSASAAGVFKDMTSQPGVKSDRYKISIKDSCELETVISNAHKTMFLSINKGAGNAWNLNWEGYEGFPVSTYFIYRGTSRTKLILLDAVPGSSTQYIDNTAPSGDVYYQLEVIRPTPCNPAQEYNSAHSNIATNNVIGIHENTMESFVFSIYPNPTSDLLTVNLEQVMDKKITLNVYNALGELVKTKPMEQNKLQLNVSDLNSGFYVIELKSATGMAKQKLTIQK